MISAAISAVLSIVLVLIIWAVLYALARLSRRARGMPVGTAKEQTHAWSIAIASLVLTGLVIVYTASSTGNADFFADILVAYGGMLFLGVFVPIIWVMVRNQQLAAEVKQRTRAEAEVRLSNVQLSESLEKLKKAQQQMIHQERVKAVGQMASGIAHDFGNALMPVVGLSRLLLDKPELLDDKEETLAILKILVAGATDAREVSGRLKEFYRPEAESRYVPLDLNEVVQSTVLLTKPRWQAEMRAEGKTVSIDTDLDKVPAVIGSELQLREVLTNLIFNSMDAMPKGGLVSIKTRSDGRSVTIELMDTGIGMSEEVRQHCFDAFYSTKDGKGTGMGLSMVQDIIARHSGNVSVTSEEGKGTTFLIRLPAGELKAARDAAIVTAAPAVAPVKVLIADDHVGSQEMLKRYLEMDGHTVTTASGGVQATKLLKKERFDLVVTDRAMPDLNGDMVAIAAKSSDPETGVIMLTGFGDMMKEKKEYPTAVDLIMSKPVDPDEMRRAMAEVLGRGEG